MKFTPKNYLTYQNYLITTSNFLVKSTSIRQYVKPVAAADACVDSDSIVPTNIPPFIQKFLKNPSNNLKIY